MVVRILLTDGVDPAVAWSTSNQHTRAHMAAIIDVCRRHDTRTAHRLGQEIDALRVDKYGVATVSMTNMK